MTSNESSRSHGRDERNSRGARNDGMPGGKAVGRGSSEQALGETAIEGREQLCSMFRENADKPEIPGPEGAR